MYEKKQTRFKQKVRISEKNLLWLKENKDCRTMAGFLDKIINERKKKKLVYPQHNFKTPIMKKQ